MIKIKNAICTIVLILTDGALVLCSVRNMAKIMPTKLASMRWYIDCVAKSEKIYRIEF